MSNPAGGRRWLPSTRSVFLFLLLVSFAYNGNYLRGGFQADEFFFLNMLRQDPLPFSRWLGFWSVDEWPAITSLWWFEGGDLGVFWRPVPSLLFEGSVRLFGERALPLHLLSVLVHGLVGATLFLLVRRLTGRPLLAFLAGLFFLSCEDHSMGVGWIATFTDLLCVLFVNLSLLAHARWLSARRLRALAVSLASLALALLSKESAAVAPLLLVLMTFFMPRGREVDLPAPTLAALRTRGTDLLRDALSWAPPLAMLVAYLALYRLLGFGFGEMSSGLYVDPFADPGRYAARLVRFLPVMWLATLSPVPPSLALFLPRTLPWLAAAGALAFALWVAGLWSLRRSALVVWAMAAYLVALLPQIAGDVSERGLYFPQVGASVLLASLAVRIGFFAPDAPALARRVGWAVLVAVLAPGIVLSAALPYVYLPSLEKLPRQVATAVPHVERSGAGHVLLLNTPGMSHTFYPPAILRYRAGDLDARVLSSLNGVVSVERTDERSFVIRADRKGWLTNFFAAILRAAGSAGIREVYERDLLTATVVEKTADGRDLLAVRFRLDRPLGDPDLLFLQWDGEAFRPIDLAALPAGKSVTLADTSDVWASMM